MPDATVDGFTADIQALRRELKLLQSDLAGLSGGMGGGNNVMAGSMGQVSTNLFQNQVESSTGILGGIGQAFAGRFPGLSSTAGTALQIGGFGVAAAGGIMSMMPSMEKYLVRETGYYQAGVGSMGTTTRDNLTASTRAALGGGMTSVGSDATVAAILSNRGVNTGSALYGNILRQVGNAGLYLNQANEVAAQSMEALTGGQSSASLISRGIFTSNPMTGEVLNEAQIFEQLARRYNVTSDMTVEEVQDELRRGFLGANIDSLDMDPAAKERFKKYLLAKASGVEVDFSSQESMENWAKNAFGEGSALENAGFSNPMAPAYQMAGSETDLIEEYAGLYGEGFEAAAGIIGDMQDAMKGFADEANDAGNALIKFNSALATILGSDVGSGFASGGFIFMGPALGLGALEDFFKGGEDSAQGGAGIGDTSLGDSLSAPIVGGNVTAGYGKAGPQFIDGTHNGIDYGVPEGTVVRAAHDGTVQKVYHNKAERSYGLYIVLDHGGGYTTTYAHLSKAYVSNGDSVKKNQPIGESGKTGTTDAHLHFEVKKNGKDIPPAQFNPSAAGGAGSSDMGMLWGGPSASGGYGSGNNLLPSISGGGSGSSSGANIASLNSGGSGSAQVTINVNVATASEEEARRFARIVKQQLEEDSFVDRMGAR